MYLHSNLFLISIVRRTDIEMKRKRNRDSACAKHSTDIYKLYMKIFGAVYFRVCSSFYFAQKTCRTGRKFYLRTSYRFLFIKANVCAYAFYSNSEADKKSL